jgi:putative endonuclease
VVQKWYFIYILMNQGGAALYTGVTNDLCSRVVQHRSGAGGGFSSRYRTEKLVHFEIFQDVKAAIAREKQIKSWRRSRKDALIRSKNPEFLDLADEAARVMAELRSRIG